jgi:hypothetical protein
MTDSDNLLDTFPYPPFFESEQLDLIGGLLHELYCEFDGIDNKLTTFIVRLCAETMVVQRGPFVLNDQFIELKNITEHFLNNSHSDLEAEHKKVLQTVALYFDDIANERVVDRGVHAAEKINSAGLYDLIREMADEIKCPSCAVKFPKIRAIEITKGLFRCPKCNQLIH